MYVEDATKKVGKEVTLRGWVYRKIESGGIIFVILRDRTGIMQIVVKGDGVNADSWKDAQDTTIWSSIIVKGFVKQDERAPTGFELQASSFKNVHVAELFPITEYRSTELILISATFG